MLAAAALAVSSELTDAEVEEVLACAERARVVDGSPPLNEAAVLHLRHPRSDVQHLRVLSDGLLVGYAQLEVGADASVTQLVVDPDQRRQGIGTRLARELIAAAPTELRAWSAGASPAAAALASRVGVHVGRELSIMQRDLTTGWPEPPAPSGLQIRPFRVGHDEPAWLAVNARAFVHHPEQGSITAEDLAQRLAESWFDPAGFLLAIQDGAMVGFHWTKQHEGRLGEVYVLGVDPSSGGSGLGKVLLSAGLRHLRDRGNTIVELYVESDHVPAVGLYRGYGFVPVSRDVMYVRPPSSTTAGRFPAPGGHDAGDPTTIPSQQET